MPEESFDALEIERTISAIQAKEFTQQGASPIGPSEELARLPVQSIVDRLSHVTERPSLRYRAYVYRDQDPNAAALADGRIYLSTGMFQYLSSRGSRPDELAFIIGHELAHTVAQHLVKRYRYLQRQQLLIGLAEAGVAVATRGASEGAQGAGRLALDVASMLQQVAVSGYSQEQELEADQLGVRYVQRAGFDPQAALDVLNNFSRFDTPSLFLRTHPYSTVRAEYLARHLAESAISDQPSAISTPIIHEKTGEQRRRLLEAQKLYPKNSVSWKNLQQQLEALERNK
ncbi:MAG: M48 family metallopeptidase [Candidatus Omnitrophica bacterium]|nr:M48 family metallopeptidase [Candidatus Omnitrophota bacterium]